jgi:hypothetical protein
MKKKTQFSKEKLASHQLPSLLSNYVHKSNIKLVAGKAKHKIYRERANIFDFLRQTLCSANFLLTLGTKWSRSRCSTCSVPDILDKPKIPAEHLQKTRGRVSYTSLKFTKGTADQKILGKENIPIHICSTTFRLYII